MSRNTNSNIFLGLITGAALGTIAAILYAPQKGSDTRRQIMDTAQTALDAVADAAEELKGRAKQAYLDGATTVEERLTTLIDHAHTGAEDLVPMLEAKLAALKNKTKQKVTNMESKLT